MVHLRFTRLAIEGIDAQSYSRSRHDRNSHYYHRQPRKLSIRGPCPRNVESLHYAALDREMPERSREEFSLSRRIRLYLHT